MIAQELKAISEFEHQPIEKVKAKNSSRSAKLWNAFIKWLKGPEMTFEEWERLERKYSPHSSHHAQIYFRDRWF